MNIWSMYISFLCFHPRRLARWGLVLYLIIYSVSKGGVVKMGLNFSGILDLDSSLPFSILNVLGFRG